jgi:hypothetical protein
MSNTKTNENIDELIKDKGRLLDEKESSRVLGVSNQTLRQSIRYKKKIPFYKVNNRILYKVADILEYLAVCRVEPLKD